MMINASHVTTQCNNHPMTERTHIPRRPCFSDGIHGRPSFTLPATLSVTRIFCHYPTRILSKVKKPYPSGRVRKTMVAWQHCYPESFCKSGKFLRQGIYLLKTVRLARKLSGWLGNCPDNPQTVRTIQKLFRQSRNCPDNQETFWTTQKLSGQSRNCPDNPKTVRTIQKLS